MRDRLLLAAVMIGAALVATLLVIGRPSSKAPVAQDVSEGGSDGGGALMPSAQTRLSDTAPPASASASTPKPPPAPPAYVRLDPRSAEECGEGMALIDGVYCPYVGHACTRFLIEERDVCQSFAPDVICEGRLQHRRYCMDLYEYPNQEGVLPVVMVDYNDAKRACAVEGKRLCTTEEWERACEGPGMWPYPYGAERDPSACNIDREYSLPEFERFSDPWKISEEVSRLDKRVPSGSMPRCVSPFGVRDMTGNVDEWVTNEKGKVDDKPFRSSLKGGYWGPIRARCRPMTSSHNEWFSFYQVGFRCCKDARTGAAIEAPPKGTRVPRSQKMDVPARPTP